MVINEIFSTLMCRIEACFLRQRAEQKFSVVIWREPSSGRSVMSYRPGACGNLDEHRRDLAVLTGCRPAEFQAKWKPIQYWDQPRRRFVENTNCGVEE